MGIIIVFVALGALMVGGHSGENKITRTPATEQSKGVKQ